jgi:hypothetical protein
MAELNTTREQWDRPVLTALLKLPAVDVDQALEEHIARLSPDVAPRANAVAVVAVVAVAATIAKSPRVLEQLSLQERAALAQKVREIRADETLAKTLAGPAVSTGIERVIKVHSISEVITSAQTLTEVADKLETQLRSP